MRRGRGRGRGGSVSPKAYMYQVRWDGSQKNAYLPYGIPLELFPFFQILVFLEFVWFNHENIIRTGTTCKKTRCYMRDSSCRWLIVENAKIFRNYINIFEFFYVKEIAESWLLYEDQFSRINQSCFLTETIKQN